MVFATFDHASVPANGRVIQEGDRKRAKIETESGA
jgi:hypothetical protein